jgi:hypothetical protein
LPRLFRTKSSFRSGDDPDDASQNLLNGPVVGTDRLAAA